MTNLYIYIYTYTYTYIYIYIHIHIYILTYKYIDINIHIQIQIFIHIQLTQKHICRWTHKHIHRWTHTNTLIICTIYYICIWICVYTSLTNARAHTDLKCLPTLTSKRNHKCLQTNEHTIWRANITHVLCFCDDNNFWF